MGKGMEVVELLIDDYDLAVSMASKNVLANRWQAKLDADSALSTADILAPLRYVDPANSIDAADVAQVKADSPWLFVPNSAPAAFDDVAETAFGIEVLVDVLLNDSDPDGDTLHVSAVGDVADGNGTVSIVEGGILFQPADDFSGEARFEYTVSDDSGATDVGEVVVTVAAGIPEGYRIIEVTGDASYDAATLRSDPGIEHIVFDFDAPPASSGLVTIANMEDGDRLITGFDIDSDSFYIEGTGETLTVSFGQDVLSFQQIWSVGLTGQAPTLIAEVQGEAGDFDAQLETISGLYGDQWLSDELSFDPIPEETSYTEVVTSDAQFDADLLRDDHDVDHIIFDFDPPPAGSGLVTIGHFTDGDQIITGFNLDVDDLYIEGVDGSEGLGTVSIAFGDDVMGFQQIWNVALTGQDAGLVDEIQAESGDLAAQIETLGVAYGSDWIVDFV